MAPPPGYVGYSAIQEPDLRTCIKTYANANHSPSQKSVMDKVAKSATDNIAGFENGFSLFHRIVLLNNLNGTKPVPAGNLIVGRMTNEFTQEQPCGTKAVLLGLWLFESSAGHRPLISTGQRHADRRRREAARLRACAASRAIDQPALDVT